MNDTRTPRRFHVPHTLVLLFGMIVLAYGMTLVLTPGSYQRFTNDAGREQVVAGSYETLADVERLPPTEIFTAIPHGFEAAGEIIFFILIIGGMFGVFRATGAADAAIGSMLRRFGSRPALLLGGTMAIFALGSATIGMAEEYIPFIPLLVALTAALGMDAIVAVGVVCVGYGVGYGAALINPFTVFIAQDIAGIPKGSGLMFRAILLVLFFIVGFHHVWRYAKKVQANPDESLVADIESDVHIKPRDDLPLTGRRLGVLIALLLALVALIVGLKFWDWYLVEMGALFLNARRFCSIDPGRSRARQCGRYDHCWVGEPTSTARAGTRGSRYVHGPERTQFLYSIGQRAGVCHDAIDGASGRPGRGQSTGRRARFSVRRWIHKYPHPDECGVDRHPVNRCRSL